MSSPTDNGATSTNFGNDLARLLQRPKVTVSDIIEEFPEESMAIVMMILMLPAATPLPTGGATHVFEIITILTAAQLIVGRRHLWLPKFLHRATLGPKTLKVLRKLTKYLSKLENFTDKANFYGFSSDIATRSAGLLIILFTLGAFVSPPFSGLDTLPAMGAVFISLALLLDNALFFIAGFILGGMGLFLEITLGVSIYDALRQKFHF